MLTSTAALATPLERTHWHVQEETYEGFPLMLRYPISIDYGRLETSLPILLTVTHKFRERQASGLPSKSYNSTLAEFDSAVIDVFNNQALGVTVLVETFGGNRAYYKYISPQADVAAARARFSKDFQNEELTWETRPDPKWTFLQTYKNDFGLNGSKQTK